MTIRELLFRDFQGCTDANCAITGPAKGGFTSKGCSCIQDMLQDALETLSSVLKLYGSAEVAGTSKTQENS